LYKLTTAKVTILFIKCPLTDKQLYNKSEQPNTQNAKSVPTEVISNKNIIFTDIGLLIATKRL